MKQRFVITAGLAMLLSMLWTLAATAQQEDAGQQRQQQDQQQTQASRPADAGNRTLTGTKAGPQGGTAQGADSRPSTEPKRRQLGSRDGSGNQGQGPEDGTGAGSPGQLGQGQRSGTAAATCAGDGPRGSATSNKNMPSTARQEINASSGSGRTGASRRGRGTGRGCRR